MACDEIPKKLVGVSSTREIFVSRTERRFRWNTHASTAPKTQKKRGGNLPVWKDGKSETFYLARPKWKPYRCDRRRSSIGRGLAGARASIRRREGRGKNAQKHFNAKLSNDTASVAGAKTSRSTASIPAARSLPRVHARLEQKNAARQEHAGRKSRNATAGSSHLLGQND